MPLIIIIFIILNLYAEEPIVYRSLKEALKKPNKVTHLALITDESFIDCNLKDIKRLNNLEVFILSESSVTSLPDEIKDLKRLKKIEFYWNGTGKKNEIDWDRELSNLCSLDSLEYLKLGPYNIIEHLPPEIKCLRNLKVLNLEQTIIFDLPKEIENLHKLEILNLNSTPIENIPKELSNIKSLKKVYLIDSKLSRSEDSRKKVKLLLNNCDVVFKP